MVETIYTCQEVADMFHVKVDTVYKWIRRGKVQATPYGFKRKMFTESQVMELKALLGNGTGGVPSGKIPNC